MSNIPEHIEFEVEQMLSEVTKCCTECGEDLEEHDDEENEIHESCSEGLNKEILKRYTLSN